jgi:succinyl-CoA synthetase alpha subunit
MNGSQRRESQIFSESDQMAFLVDATTRVLVQGLTGQMGRYAVGQMRQSGAEIVAGVTPGKRGQTVEGIPVFDDVAEAVHQTGANASILFVPAGMLVAAALECIAARLSPIVLMVDGVAAEDSIRMVQAAQRAGVILIGPNSPGVISPGHGMLGALRPNFFLKGPVAVISRSGGMMSTISATLTEAGVGQTTCVGVGGDLVIGFDIPAAALLAEADEKTEALVVFGELGTTQEERLGRMVQSGSITKPVIAYIAGVAARPGIRYSHAGAMTDQSSSSGLAKREMLASSGVFVVDRYTEIPRLVRSLMSR